MDAEKEVSWEQRVQQAVVTLERELSRDGASLTATERSRLEVQKRLLQSMLNRSEDSMKDIVGVPAEQRDYWKHQLRTIGLLLDERGTPAWNRRAAIALRELSAATSQLASLSSLDLKNLAFCSKVDGFGTLTEFAKAEFQAGQEVLLYVEVDHFKSEARGVAGVGGGRGHEQYETELRASYQILDPSSRRVGEIDLPTDKQSCRSPRRDYFIAYRLYIPKNIEPGTYTLQLIVEDVKGQKFGQGSLEFSIKGPG